MNSKVKVCHLTSIHSRYDARILLKQCVSLVKFGYDVTLVVNDDMENETFNGVKIISTGFIPKNRIDRFLHCSQIMFENAKKIDADIYQFHDPDLMKVGIKLKKIGKKVVYDMHEDVPIDIAYKEWIPFFLRGIVSKCAFIYEKKYIGLYETVLTVTPHIVDRVSKLNKNTYLITNYPILDKKKDNKHKQSNSFNLCFAGTIVRQWQHKQIIQSIGKISNTKYLLAGSYDEGYFEELKTLPEWSNVDYHGKITHDEVQNIYDNSNVGMALLAYSPTTGDKIGTLGNTKLFEYMASGLPIICSASQLWTEIIDKYHCGLAVDPSDINAIKEAILFLKNNPEKAHEMGCNGITAVYEEYNWEVQERKLKEIYGKLY